ncbi:MAG: cysteine desulfurase [Firmicutes bacterium]|nr:cysteine desulfurase [Bacillota bacterium]
MRQVYLDNSATTAVLPEVAAEMQKVLLDAYGNPSSLHTMGVEAERIKNAARRILAEACGGREEELIFTSGGTEANNLAVKGVARRLKRRGRHLITTQVEHPSVLYACRALEEEGFSVTYLPVDGTGRVRLDALEEALQEDTLLVSVMHVNNETGTVMPVAEIGRLVKEKAPEALFHVDAVQSFGKLPVSAGDWQADLITISAHKIHGPKGCGALWRRAGVPLAPLFHGGDQEAGLRPGTENMAGIAGFAAAARLALAEQSKRAAGLARLKEFFLRAVFAAIPDITVNSPKEAAPHIVSITFPGVKGEVLVHELTRWGIYVSTGSACHSRRADPSHVLLAMGRTPKEIEATLRFSFSPLNTEAELEYTVEKLQQAVAHLRRLTRRK